jgi:hypothetical protein
MKIAAFNGFAFHDEMFGYILYFCKKYNHELTLFCHTEVYNHYVEFYKKHFKGYYFNVIDGRLFECHKYSFDCIFLITDDDPNFKCNDPYINNITIRIDHDGDIRRENICKYIATRPFNNNYRKWALPCYPIYCSADKYCGLKEKNVIEIMILGCCKDKYDFSIINRLKTENNSRILIHIVSRIASKDNIFGINDNYDIHLYTNITTGFLMRLLKRTNYLLTDAVNDSDFHEKRMSGAVPMAFSTLTTLIISKQTNKYYNFKNVIEFDIESTEPIVLNEVNLYELEKEREELVSMFSNIVLEYFKDF